MTQSRVRLTLDIEGKGRFQETRLLTNVPDIDRFLAVARNTLLSQHGLDRQLPLTGPSFLDLEGEES